MARQYAEVGCLICCRGLASIDSSTRSQVDSFTLHEGVLDNTQGVRGRETGGRGRSYGMSLLAPATRHDFLCRTLLHVNFINNSIFVQRQISEELCFAPNPIAFLTLQTEVTARC